MPEETTEEFRKRRLTEISQMQPEQRVIALRQLDEEFKQRQEEIKQQEERLRQETEARRKESIAIDELAAQGQAEIKILERVMPKVKEVKIEDLFKPAQEEKEEDALEKKLAETRLRELTEEQQRQYTRQLAQQPVEELYKRFGQIENEIKNAYESGSPNAYIVQKREEELRSIGMAAHYKTAGGYRAGSEEIMKHLSIMERRLYE